MCAIFFCANVFFTACYAEAKSNCEEGLFRADLDDFPEIYDKRFAEAANTAYREHDQKLLAGCTTTDVLDCSFDTDNLTFELCGLGYRVWGSDISRALLDEGAKKAAIRGFGVPLTRCDFRELTQHFRH